MDEMTWPIPLDTLSDGVIRLRRPCAGDVDDVYDTAVDPLSVNFTSVPGNYTRDMAAEYLRSCADHPDLVFWAIELTGDPGHYAGNISLRLTDAAVGSVSVSYATAPWARGRGIMPRALDLVADHALAHGTHRIELSTIADNVRSRSVAERCGFTFEGIKRQAAIHRGGYVDTAHYSLLAADRGH
ncbi:GNAT family N-acetyltransferase [Corynebacterium sp. CCM 8835]|uniref:GNAT family N-acetyltransferase n=1 Tax=Corynebacterium antarcticum TaxID=2800405 RepID=A0ABS1FHS9_9CORY|nr:GNAT family protein [Corynebacterium antarcticum]MCK7642083.1 GNAT family N-acetyltransferase [Corynebacterium antarcticum]MCL0245308.1 GNAT family N-acetyltransferase [Corynebacterium antarcticum]MCX7539143.1 GNAT family protein [Corynebacterium antarcticum]